MSAGTYAPPAMLPPTAAAPPPTDASLGPYPAADTVVVDLMGPYADAECPNNKPPQARAQPHPQASVGASPSLAMPGLGADATVAFSSRSVVSADAASSVNASLHTLAAPKTWSCTHQAVVEPPAILRSPTLSSDVTPFFLGCSTRGRMKSHWWVDVDDEEPDDDHPTSYLDAARRPLKPVDVSLS